MRKAPLVPIALVLMAAMAVAYLLPSMPLFLWLALLAAGCLLGGVPAVLMALTGGVRTTLLTVTALVLVQQIDNMVVSPRVTGAVTGLHPALVLAAITVGGSLSGVAGMLFSVPALLTFRSIARNWPIHCKNV